MLPVENWDFNKANTKEYTHCFHIYPAMMIPQIARRIIQDYLTDQDRTILDPYCGSGTSLVEANIAGKSAIGIDINPLALMIAQSKITKISADLLQKHLDAFSDELRSDFANFDQTYQTPAGFNNTIKQNDTIISELDFWFPPKAQVTLLQIKNYIEQIDHLDVQRFFNIAFSETIRDVSYLNKGGYKRHRMKNYEIFDPDTSSLMTSKLERNRIALDSFTKRTDCFCNANEFYNFNTVYTVEPLSDRQIDAIVTSPPYGDSRTTVAYGEFSSLALQWLGYPAHEAKRLDNQLMGGSKPINLDDATFPAYLRNIIMDIKSQDEDRARNVIGFYADYSSSIAHVAELVKPNGYAIYVVGNRIVKNHQLPTDKITADFFAQHGFDHIETIERTIPTKRMPRSNSPSNEIGKTVSTMNEEYIVIMRKQNNR
jgi:tRNA G10  N-methylase Trm11